MGVDQEPLSLTEGRRATRRRDATTPPPSSARHHRSALARTDRTTGDTCGHPPYDERTRNPTLDVRRFKPWLTGTTTTNHHSLKPDPNKFQFLDVKKGLLQA